MICTDDLVYAGHAGAGTGDTLLRPGHILVEPQRHVPGLAKLVIVEAQLIVVGAHKPLTSDSDRGHRADKWPDDTRGSEQAVHLLCAEMPTKLAEEGT